MSYILSFKRKGTVTPPLSDLVALGILPKQISEFTNDDIGTEVSIPYTDASGIISNPIVFEVVGVNHHTTAEHPQTITLMTKNIIRYAAFDAMEPSNVYSDLRKYGNNRWGVSNIRQWLNSAGAADSWWSAQHTADAAPTADKVSGSDGAYADAPGFLAGFSTDVLQHFTDIENTTILCDDVDGGGTETTVDKVFLPSYTEMFGLNNAGTSEGTHLSKFNNNDSRKKNGSYWMRSPYPNVPIIVRYVNGSTGSYNDDYNTAYSTDTGIAPIIVLH